MKTIQVSEETYDLIKDQLKVDETPINTMEDFIGKNIFVRTVTYHLLGEVTKIIGNLLFMRNASWVADSGRFGKFIKDGDASEVEYVGDWFINVNSIVDGGVWKHKLIKETK